MKKFQINKEYEVICEHQSTRNGFRHVAILLKNGEEIDRTKVCYQNRTWESFQFETVLHKMISEANILNEQEKKKYFSKQNDKEHEKVNQMFGTVKSVALMGEIFCEDKKDSNDWKKRMMKAGLSGIDFPDDWDSLSEEEKERRLDGALGVMAK